MVTLPKQSLIVADQIKGRFDLFRQPANSSPASYRLFEMLPMMPRFTIEHVRQKLDTTFPTATTEVKVLEDLGNVTAMTGEKGDRKYSHHAYVELRSR